MRRIDSTGLVFLEMIDETGKPALPGVVCLEYDMFFRLYKCIASFYKIECDVMSEAGIV